MQDNVIHVRGRCAPMVRALHARGLPAPLGEGSGGDMTSCEPPWAFSVQEFKWSFGTPPPQRILPGNGDVCVPSPARRASRKTMRRRATQHVCAHVREGMRVRGSVHDHCATTTRPGKNKRNSCRRVEIHTETSLEASHSCPARPTADNAMFSQ